MDPCFFTTSFHSTGFRVLMCVCAYVQINMLLYPSGDRCQSVSSSRRFINSTHQAAEKPAKHHRRANINADWAMCLLAGRHQTVGDRKPEKVIAAHGAYLSVQMHIY